MNVSNNRSKAVDPGSERAVVAGVLQYGGDTYLDISNIVNSECFTVDSSQIAWGVLKSIYDKDSNKKVDTPTFLSEASAMGLSDFYAKEQERKYLQALYNFNVEQESILPLAKRIRKLQVARNLQQRAVNIHKNLDNITGNESIQEIISIAENPIFEASTKLNATTEQDITHISEGIDEELRLLEENPTDIVGISTGYTRLDTVIGGGIQEDALHIIAARMKVGKSALADCIAIKIAGQQHYPVLNLDTELSGKKHRLRMLAMLSSVSIKDIITGKFGLDPVKKAQVYKAKEFIKKIPYDYRSVSGKSFEEILSIMRRWIVRNVGFDQYGNTNKALIIYDYIKIQDKNELTNMAEHQVVGFQANSLKEMCNRYRVPILSFAQLNRDGIVKEDSSGIALSDRIGMYCDSITILKEKSPEEIKLDGPEEGTHKLVTILARDGSGHEDGNYINLQFDKEHTRFVEKKTKFELKMSAKPTSTEVDGEIDVDNQPF